MSAENNKNIAPVSAQSHKDWYDELPEDLSEAVDDYSLPDTSDWDDLAELSSQTIFEGIEVYGGDAVFEEGKFVAPATVYVELVYDPHSEDPVGMSDSYPARVFFTLKRSGKEKPTIEIEGISVDTSSFYR